MRRDLLLISLVALLCPATLNATPSRCALLPLQQDATLPETEAARIQQGVWRALDREGLAPIAMAEVERLLAATDLACTSAKCLAESAGILRASQLIGGRLIREDQKGTLIWTLALWLYSTEAEATVATLRDQCGACNMDQSVAWSGKLASRLLQQARAAGTPARIEVLSSPSGAQVSIDGTAVGVTNMTYGVSPGRHTVAIQLSGHALDVHEVTVAPGATISVKAELRPSGDISASSARDDSSGLFSARVLKWVSLGLAVAGLSSGITLVVLDGRSNCETAHADHECRETYNTLAPGVALSVAGGLAALGSGYLFYLDTKRRSDRSHSTDVSIDSSTDTSTSIFPVAIPHGAGVGALLRF